MTATFSPTNAAAAGDLPTIPVVDMQDWTATGEGAAERKANFVRGIRSGLHEVGFFGVVNAGTDSGAVDQAYAAMAEFFAAPLEKKDECHKPELEGARGYVHSEMAQGHSRMDHKEHYHIGPIDEAVTEANALTNVFPTWMDMETPLKGLFGTLNGSRGQLEGALSLAMGEEEGFLSGLTSGGSALLRALHYPSNPDPGNFWGAPHTDINLFTILPRATEEGLQVFLPKAGQADKEYAEQEGSWVPVTTPPNCLIVNGGDKLQAMSNGYFRSSVHRIVAKPNIERYSMVYFIHPRNECSVAPRPTALHLSAIAAAESSTAAPTTIDHASLGKPAPALFPADVTSWEMQLHRFQENGLAPVVKWDSTYALAVEKQIASGNAHHAVRTTSRLWRELRKQSEAEGKAI